MKSIGLCIFSALCLILSFPNFNLWLLVWFGFVPLFFALKNKSKGKTFLLAYLTGVIFWLGIIYWLIHVTLIGTILLILYLALYFGLFSLLIKSYELRVILRHTQGTSLKDTERNRSASYELLFIPSFWVLLEYLRSHLLTGFPWTLLGYSQYLNLPVIQIADITGAWGVSFLVQMVNVTIYSVIGSQLSVIRRIRKYLMPTLICLVFTLIYGYYKLHHSTTFTTQPLSPLKISVIQGNIPQELKWDAAYKDFIIDRYLNLTNQAAKDRPDLIIWPEAALPVVLEEEPIFFEKIKEFTKEMKIPLLLGAVTFWNNFYYNSALFISNEGKLLDRYNKLHLVPFGEYIPLRRILGFLETVVPIGDFTHGKEYTFFKAHNLQLTTYNFFSVLICFEDLFPQISRQFVKRGTDFLVNITNDAWYKKTSAPYQHLQASVFRAVENRVFLVRAANTGVSGFIDHCGKIISLVQDKTGKEIFIDGYRTQRVMIPKRNLTFYTRFGDIFILLLSISCLYAIFRFIR